MDDTKKNNSIFLQYSQCTSAIVKEDDPDDEEDELEPFFNQARSIVQKRLEEKRPFYIVIQFFDGKEKHVSIEFDLEYSHGSFVRTIEDFNTIVVCVKDDNQRDKPTGGFYGLLIFPLLQPVSTLHSVLKD